MDPTMGGGDGPDESEGAGLQPRTPRRWARPRMSRTATPWRRPLMRPGALPTLVVAAIAAFVTLGGTGLDAVLAEPSIGNVSVGEGLQIQAAPGWTINHELSGENDGVVLQKGDAVMDVRALGPLPGEMDPRSLLERVIEGSKGWTVEVTFGEIGTDVLGGNDAAYATFVAIIRHQARDGVMILVIRDETPVLFQGVAPQGDLASYADDIKRMASSLSEGSR